MTPAFSSFIQANDMTTIILSSTCRSQVRPIAVGQSDGARQEQAGTFPKSQEMVKGISNYKDQRNQQISPSCHNSCHLLYNNSEQEESGNSSSDSLPVPLSTFLNNTSQGSKWIRRKERGNVNIKGWSAAKSCLCLDPQVLGLVRGGRRGSLGKGD